MFSTGSTRGGTDVPLSDADLETFLLSLRTTDSSLGDEHRAGRIRRLEDLKAAVAAAQAVEVAALTLSRRAAAAAEIAATAKPGVGTRSRLRDAERAIVSDVAVARRLSPAQASHAMAFALSAPTELPGSFALFAAGQLSERRIVAIHRATAWLTPDQRRAVDADLAPQLDGWGDLQVEREATAAAYRIDPAGACARAARAESERHVSLRPAPETMTRLSALLPLPQGVAVWAALDQAARTARAAGDVRTRGQVMSDTLVERVTGQASAADVPIAVQLVMSDRTMTGDSDEPARIVGYGPVPAGTARDLMLGHTRAARSVRRLFTDPAGRLVTAETHARFFTPAMADLIRIRDDTCRTPWCDAPIRHTDHHDPAANGGPTALTNARGLCERCNLAAQTPTTTDHLRPPDPGPPHPPGVRPLHPAPKHRRLVADIIWEIRAA